ncbi:hypothetical protein HK096_009443 [Nowakowskiella sp. JEL0078]|nr:hypothetical protein HK096_009443 [Nowakowskiella sp. JEL0078]
MTLVSSAVLFRGFPVANPIAGLSILIGFLIIVGGVALLFQYSLEVTALTRKLAADNAINVSVATRPRNADYDDDEIEITLQNRNEPKRTSLRSEQMEMSLVSENQMNHIQTSKNSRNRPDSVSPDVDLNANSENSGVWNFFTKKLGSRFVKNVGYVQQENAESNSLPALEEYRTTSILHRRAAMGVDEVNVDKIFLTKPQASKQIDIDFTKNIDQFLEINDKPSGDVIFVQRENSITRKASQSSSHTKTNSQDRLVRKSKEILSIVPKVRLSSQFDSYSSESTEIQPIIPPPSSKSTNLPTKVKIEDLTIVDVVERSGYISLTFDENRTNPQ